MNDRPHSLRIGTRASPLALAQAEQVRARLAALDPHCALEIVPMIASGDRIQDRALAEIGGKALWTKELDLALIEGRIDCAVHSMKDVETLRPPEITIAAVLPRADVRDHLVGVNALSELPHGAVVGSSAPRRKAQLLRARPDISVVLFRGNVQTRLDKLARGEVAATLLAAAGLARLGMNVGTPLEVEDWLPAPAQGAIGIEVLTNNPAAQKIVSAISHDNSFAGVAAERAFLVGLKGGCRSPVAALADVKGTNIKLRAELYSEDGRDMVSGEIEFARGDTGQASAFGRELLASAPASIKALFG